MLIVHPLQLTVKRAETRGSGSRGRLEGIHSTLLSHPEHSLQVGTGRCESGVLILPHPSLMMRHSPTIGSLQSVECYCFLSLTSLVASHSFQAHVLLLTGSLCKLGARLSEARLSGCMSWAEYQRCLDSGEPEGLLLCAPVLPCQAYHDALHTLILSILMNHRI